jgi:hypothetical protein
MRMSADQILLSENKDKFSFISLKTICDICFVLEPNFTILSRLQI